MTLQDLLQVFQLLTRKAQPDRIYVQLNGISGNETKISYRMQNFVEIDHMRNKYPSTRCLNFMKTTVCIS